MVQIETLPNGVRLVTEAIPTVRSAALGFWIAGGSREEKDGESGAAHFIEHMLFKGTETRSAADIARQTDAIGGQMNAFTTKECTCFYAHVLDDHLAQALDILWDMVFCSRFDQKAVETERGVILEEIDMYEDTPDDLCGEKLFEHVYAGSPLSRPILGKEETALNGTWTTPFTDVPDWAAPYIGYAYDQGLTVGVSADRFAPNAPIRATEYLTLVLRALGYSSGEDFAWDQAWNLTDELGVTDGSYGPKTTAFDRGDVAWISLRALDAKDKKTKRTLRTTLKLKSDVDQCVWEETWQSCLKDQMVFSFAPAEGSPRTYTKFTVDSAWANGQPCQIKQFSTKRDVTSQLKKYPKDTRDAVGSETFALVYLSYDEAAVLAAATETVEDNGHTYPVIRFQMNVTGTLAGSPAVKEKAEMAYYILGYWGEEYAKS